MRYLDRAFGFAMETWIPLASLALGAGVAVTACGGLTTSIEDRAARDGGSASDGTAGGSSIADAGQGGYGGTAGTENGGHTSDGGDTGPHTECQPGAKKCFDGTPQICTAQGQWENGAGCPYACNDGACIGSCIPNSKRCTGSTPQICTAQGQWENAANCPYLCNDGTCAGSCIPSSKQCTGSTPQICSAQGLWENAASCPYVCNDGACAGSCIPSSKQCTGSTPQICSAQGQWENGAICPYLCNDGTCTGSCIPSSKQCTGSTPQICSAQGQWENLGICPEQCVKGSCWLNGEGLVISQVYPGAGSSLAIFDSDYVELFNRSASAQSLAGKSLQKASIAGVTWAVHALPEFILQPGQHFMIKILSYSSDQGSTNLPQTPDDTASTSLNFSAAGSKIAIVETTTALTCGGNVNGVIERCPKGSWLDMIGFSKPDMVVTDYEGSPFVGPIGVATWLVRKGSGCVDTNNNAADFELLTAPPEVSNFSSPLTPCSWK